MKVLKRLLGRVTSGLARFRHLKIMKVHATTLFYKEEQLFEIINNDIIQNSKSGARRKKRELPLS